MEEKRKRKSKISWEETEPIYQFLCEPSEKKLRCNRGVFLNIGSGSDRAISPRPARQGREGRGFGCQPSCPGGGRRHGEGALCSGNCLSLAQDHCVALGNPSSSLGSSIPCPLRVHPLGGREGWKHSGRKSKRKALTPGRCARERPERGSPRDRDLPPRLVPDAGCTGGFTLLQEHWGHPVPPAAPTSFFHFPQVSSQPRAPPLRP